VKLTLNGIHQLLSYADDVNLLGDKIDTIKKNTETLIDASKEVGLEINVEKTEYMLLSRHQTVGQNRDIKLFPYICVIVYIFLFRFIIYFGRCANLGSRLT
jgi:hypothetical protein